MVESFICTPTSGYGYNKNSANSLISSRNLKLHILKTYEKQQTNERTNCVIELEHSRVVVLRLLTSLLSSSYHSSVIKLFNHALAQGKSPILINPPNVEI